VADWDERYRRGEHAGDEPLPLLARLVPTLLPGRALDLACGAGRRSSSRAGGSERVMKGDTTEALSGAARLTPLPGAIQNFAVPALFPGGAIGNY
jgi:hypothetical protein